jgi:hypothetical protein
MPQVMTTNAIVTCPHQQPGISTPLDPICSAENGGFVLAENDTGQFPTCVANPPCVGYQLASMGLNASRLGQRKVILVTDVQQTMTGLPITITESHQTLDDSTTAGLPTDGSAPIIAPECLDLVRPIVIAAPPTLAFSVQTQSPPPVPIVFTSFTAFPLRWSLRLVNETGGVSIDATNGLPGGLIVAPAGGGWSTPNLTVTVTASAAFLTLMGPALIRLYLTAVSRRGLSGFTSATITVSP